MQLDLFKDVIIKENCAEIVCKHFPENHLFFPVDGKKDFIVFNANFVDFSEDIDFSEDNLLMVDLPECNNLKWCKSAAWSSGCTWFFIAQKGMLFLINVYQQTALINISYSNKFIRYYIDNKNFNIKTCPRRKTIKHEQTHNSQSE